MAPQPEDDDEEELDPPGLSVNIFDSNRKAWDDGRSNGLVVVVGCRSGQIAE